MKTFDNDSNVISNAETDSESTPQNNYEPVRYNALKHGILSKQVVLVHEDENEFSDLLTSLIDEHRPTGPTELHLVEELASIMWRKRRVLLAEGAHINRGLHSVINNKLRSPIPMAVPCNRSILNEDTDLHDLMKSTPEQVIQSHQEATVDLAATNKAAEILRKSGPNAYKNAQRALSSESLSFWKDHLKDNEYPDTAEGLAQFIQEILWPICVRMVYETKFTPAIQAQTLGEGLRAEGLENLTRYETHLDRKFERTLAMLLKMKELRKSVS
ncbi:MAG: hypothetical protein U1D41_00975 [Nitrosomonas sp.]|uniref:hypothetical protein n=1 Tax=Pseudomonadati TaxID=3379134 RepID=UPI002729FCD9|nr:MULTISPECIES: hypothetical protein [Bacteria]MDP3664455.1 hypothetical protein [Nitrosomonas sp.]MDZ4104738.1 hypothetical protein [Nitrosomonas sp.]